MADWKAPPGCDEFTGKDPWEPPDPCEGYKQPRERTPLLGEEKDDYGSVTSTNPISGLVGEGGYIDCPHCHSSWSVSNLPHDCRDTVLRKLLTAICRDADETYSEHSEMLGKHDEWLTMMGRALAEHLHDHRQVELVFEDELVQRAFTEMIARVEKAERRTDEQQALIAKSQGEEKRLWGTLDNLKAERDHATKDKTDLSKRVAELVEQVELLGKQIEELRTENAILAERVADAEGGLFG